MKQKEKECIMSLLKHFNMVKQLNSPAEISVCFYSDIQAVIELDFDN